MNARDRVYVPGKKSAENPTWKFLSKLVARRLRKRKSDYVKHKLNQAFSSKSWWKSFNELEGKHHANVSEHHLIDNEWIITTELVRKLNDYFVTVGGERDVIK